MASLCPRHGGRVDATNAGAYGILAFCFLGLVALFLSKRWIVDLLNAL